jgi:hypothetical protein
LREFQLAGFGSSFAQTRSINDHFAVIFEKPKVAVWAQGWRFESHMRQVKFGIKRSSTASF